MLADNSSKMATGRGLGFGSPAAQGEKAAQCWPHDAPGRHAQPVSSLATDGKPHLENQGFPVGQHLPQPVGGKHVGAEGLMSHTDACSQKILPFQGFPGGSVDKNLPASAGDTGSRLVREDSTCHRPTKPAHHDY